MTIILFQFINQSTGNITGYQWDFGDGNTSNELNPVHTYFEAGDYLVSLQAYYYDTVSAVFEMMIGVGYSGTDSTMNAMFIPVFDDYKVTFIEITKNTIEQRNWTFGDGNTSQNQNPSNIYSNLGVYTVTLDAANAKANATTYSMQINLSDKSYIGYF